MEYFQRFLKIFGSLIGIILLYFVVRYAVLQFQGDTALLDKVSPATLEEVTQDPSIFDALIEPMGEEAAEDEAEEAATDGAAVADEEAEAAAEEEAATDEAAAEEELAEASADEADAEEAVAEGDMAASDTDEAAAAVDEANADEAEAASAEAEAEVDETAVEAEEEVAVAGSEEAAVEEDAEETVAESDDELVSADAETADAETTLMGGPDSVLAEFHSAVIPDEYADLVSTVEADEESIARGEATYTTLCTSCHGESGMGDGPAGQLLVPPAAPIAQTSHMVSDAYLFWRVSEGGAEFGTAMTPWKGSLDEGARWDVINYIRSIDPEAGQGGHGQQGQGEQGQGSQGAGNAADHDDEPLSEDHDWVLDTLNDGQGEPIDLVESDEITASFSDGSLSGVTACNNYAGKYQDDDVLSITISATSPLADPLERCGDGGEVDDQEEAYLEALESAASYAAQRGQMELSDEDGNVLLIFDAVPVK